MCMYVKERMSRTFVTTGSLLLVWITGLEQKLMERGYFPCPENLFTD